jgi:ATP-binding cassette subfamily B protein
VFFPFISFFSGLTSIILLLVGGIRVVEGFMSPGQLTALFRYLQMLIWPLMSAGFMVNIIQRGAVSLSRINEVMRTVPLITSPAQPAVAPITPVRTAAEFRHLTFAYNEKPVLEDINLTVEAGEWLGVLGRTGAGKSTLVKLLTRMLEPPAGTVFVKNIDVREWDLRELRGLFGVTPQDSYLFSDSIKNNIGYGLESAADTALKKAAAISAIDQDLAAFSQSYDTVIGERGLTLSGGQKQRVSISRAVIKDSEFIILDDALSAVDTETERRILSRLLAELKGTETRTTTVIIISHRVSTLGSADKVLVLDKGHVLEYGTPAELIASGGFYARTAALQQLESNE